MGNSIVDVELTDEGSKQAFHFRALKARIADITVSIIIQAIIGISSLVDVKHYFKNPLQMGCALTLRSRPDAVRERSHQLYWHTIIPLKLKLHDKKGACLQMGNQFDLDIGSHRELLDCYTRSTLEQYH